MRLQLFLIFFKASLSNFPVSNKPLVCLQFMNYAFIFVADIFLRNKNKLWIGAKHIIVLIQRKDEKL